MKLVKNQAIILLEKWEIENKADVERQEIEDIYKAKGFSGKELEMIIIKICLNVFSFYF